MRYNLYWRTTVAAVVISDITCTMADLDVINRRNSNWIALFGILTEVNG